VTPPPLDDWQLIAWLDGEADDPVREHLDRCPSCRQRRDQLALQIGRLKPRLYRVECPDPAELSRFHRNQLAADRQTWFQRHLDTCSYCARELALLQRRAVSTLSAPQILEPEDGLRPLTEGVRTLLARLIGGPGMSSALLPVRGERAGPRLYEAEGFKISVDSKPDDREPGRRQVIGSVLGAKGDGWSVDFWAGGEHAGPAPVVTAPVDELGFFTAGGLMPGRYGLNVRSPEGALEVRVPNVAV
jgi:hypothetical protein